MSAAVCICRESVDREDKNISFVSVAVLSSACATCTFKLNHA